MEPRSSYMEAVIPFIEDVMPVVAMLRGRGRRGAAVAERRRTPPPRPPPDMAEEGREAVLFSRDKPRDITGGVRRLVESQVLTH